jgi:hypothetical protein
VVACLWVLVAGYGTCQGQEASTPLKVDKKIPVTGSEKMDFVFTRSVLVGGTVQGGSYEVARSGAYSFGISYGIPISKSLELNVEPRVLWHKLVFANGAADKWFPSSDSSSTLIYEKQRISYLELPLAFKFKLARNNANRYRVLLEMGFVSARRIGSTFKTRHYQSVDSGGGSQPPKITWKTNRIVDLNDWRFGPFMRLGTSWGSLYGFYRMTNIFSKDKYFVNPDGTTRAYPSFSKFELGVTLAL